MVILSADPNALVRALIDHHDPEYAHEVFAALKRELAPSAMDILASLASGTPRPGPDPASFSEQQREIVRHIYLDAQKRFQELEEYGSNGRVFPPIYDPDLGWTSDLRYLRPYWRPEDLGGEITPSRRASISRALKRLEERDIVWRIPGPGGRRTVQVRLTIDGDKLAKRLLNE